MTRKMCRNSCLNEHRTLNVFVGGDASIFPKHDNKIDESGEIVEDMSNNQDRKRSMQMDDIDVNKKKSKTSSSECDGMFYCYGKVV